MITTKIQVANKLTKSLRATIPLEIVAGLKLEAGDVIAWDLDKKTACIRKLE
jgi:hypothetical protein